MEGQGYTLAIAQGHSIIIYFIIILLYFLCIRLLDLINNNIYFIDVARKEQTNRRVD